MNSAAYSKGQVITWPLKPLYGKQHRGLTDYLNPRGIDKMLPFLVLHMDVPSRSGVGHSIVKRCGLRVQTDLATTWLKDFQSD